ncbi:sulfide-quinone oxidoreductase [Lactarius sanguifluus]|nr:sulfide-quinone oxidoreductase [Lactarius sanguifluus]
MHAKRGVSCVVRCYTAIDRVRWASTEALTKDKFRIVVLGSGGLSVAQQLYNLLTNDALAVGPTLVGAGLKQKSMLRRPLAELIPSHITHVAENVASFDPTHNDTLVVATGLQVNFSAIESLPKALADPSSGLSSIYSYQTCDKVWEDIDALRAGRAIFTQPQGVIKCAGAPQKIMWMAWDRYRTTSRGDQIKVDFFSGMPTIFAVKKYSDVLEALRVERGVGGSFGHNLVSVDAANRKAVFKNVADGTESKEDYTLLHVTPPMGPLDVLKGSAIVDAAGWVDVDKGTLQHVKPEYSNIFSLGDTSSLPTSKTAAEMTKQAPVLTVHLMDSGRSGLQLIIGYIQYNHPSYCEPEKQ